MFWIWFRGVPASASAVVPPDQRECLAMSFEGNTVQMQFMNHEDVGTDLLLRSQS